MKVDHRLISLDKLDRNRSVLVDAHSLYSIVEDLERSHPPLFSVDDLTSYGGTKLSNVIQNIVLYEHVVVDSLLFEIASDVRTACDLFPDVIKGLFIRPDLRQQINLNLQLILSRVTRGDSSREPPSGLSKEEWARWQFQESSEKPMMDRLDDVLENGTIGFVPDDDELLHMLITTPARFLGLPLCCTNSMMTLGRAHFYLELARQVDIPLSPDPIRSRYFKVLAEEVKSNLKMGMPEKVITYFEDQVLRQPVMEYDGIVSAEFAIPPVTELVVNLAKKKKMSLRQATMEVRESQNARVFREWCAKLSALRNKGRPYLKEQLEMVDQLKRVCEVWRKDVREEVSYRTRKLNLEVIPMVGNVLKAINMHEALEVKLPALRSAPKYSYFLFLNDLLRKPEDYTP